MTNPDYQRLARDFMDMWQKQMGSVVRDKQFIQAMLDMTKNWQNPYAKTQHPNTAHADDAGHGDLAQLAFRIGMCEERLAALEAGQRKAKPGRAGRGKKPRK